MLFVYGKEKCRQHDKHHENTGNAVTEQTLTRKIHGKSKSDANAKADNLPQGQTEKEFAFYGVDIDGDRDIQFVVFLHSVPFNVLQK